VLYMVEMTVNLPHGADPAQIEKLKADEKAFAEKMQRMGNWLHLWRVAGRYANVSIFDVESHDALHALLSALPLWPYLDIKVTPLVKHPSSIK
jgi:muconolactone D-isomerase